jgi:hypothetical protein
VSFSRQMADVCNLPQPPMRRITAALVRSAAQCVILLPFLIRAGPTVFRTTHISLHALRGVLSVGGF